MLTHSAFYQFVSFQNPALVVARVKELCCKLQGSILIASEGINGMVAGQANDLEAFEQAMRTEFEGRLAHMQFKHSACSSSPFGHMRVKLRPQIVALGIHTDATKAPTNKQLSPQAWRELMKDPNVLLLDNRNRFEYKLGHFKGAVDPKVSFFRDFPGYVKEQLPQWQASGKKVAMYCTGGIRCEKTNAWLAEQGASIYELEGGILNYFQSVADPDLEWEGKCFVFDNRVALNTQLREDPTPIEEIYADEPDAQWRINRARRLAALKKSD